MRKSAIFIAPLLLMSITAMAAGAPPTATSVLAAAKTASGGAAWDKIQSLRKFGTIRILGLKGPARRLIDMKTGASVTHVKLGLGTMAIGNDGETTWTKALGGEVLPEELPAQHERAVTSAYLDAKGYWYPRRWPARLKYLGTQSRHNRTYQVVQVIPKGGAPAALWFDSRTHILARQVQDFAMGKAVTTFSDYRVRDGVKMSFHSRQSVWGNNVELQVKTVKINVPTSAKEFAEPAQKLNDFSFANGGTSVTLPFKPVMGRIIEIQAAINGHPVRLLLDTGGAEAVGPALASSLKLDEQGSSKGHGWGAKAVEVRWARVQTLTLGGLVTLHNQVFRVLPLGDVNKVVDTKTTGLVGYEIFKRFVVRIDYAHKKLTLIKPSAFNPGDAGRSMPMKFAGSLPAIKGSLDGLKGEFTIDTGMGASLMMWTPFVKRHDLMSRYKVSAPMNTGGGIGGGLLARYATAGVFMFGPIAIHDPIFFLTRSSQGFTALKDAAGNIGGGILNRFTVTFDYAQNRLYLKPNAHFNAHHAIALTAEALKKFVGRYQIKRHFAVTISRSGDQLSMQLPGQSKLPIYPESKTAFFMKIADVQINFDVSAGKQITGLVIHQAGRSVPAKRLETTAMPRSSAEPKVIKLAALSLQKFVGRYQVAPNFSIAITRTGDQLKAQGTGQPALPIFPESKTEFFSKAVNVQFSFETNADGKVTGVVVHQSGRNIPGKKVN